jgi:hypothetical protein
MSEDQHEYMPPPPKKKKHGTKGTPPDATTGNLKQPSNGEMVNLNFKVPPDFKRDFKTFCTEHDLKMKDALMEMFSRYRKDLVR